MIGKKNGLTNIFNQQAAFQKLITSIDLPSDNVVWSSYHILGLQEEIGEVLKADKRWKTHRNAAYDPENKLDEIVDCFITLVNIALFSGFGSQEIYSAIENKIKENVERLDDSDGEQQ